MAIEFRCPCGAVCSAAETRVGELFHCEACGLDTPVPSPEQAQAAGHAAHQEAAQDMIHQVQDLQGAAAAEAAARHQEDLAALLKETGGNAPEPDAEANRKAGVAALHEQLGSHAGAAEMAEQMRAVREGQGGAAMAGAPPVVLGPLSGPRPPSKRPPTGKARAAHHIGFKRAIWLPSLLVSLVCLGVGVYCFFPGGSNPYARHLERFQGLLKDAGITEPEIVTYQDKAWAIPKGAEHSITSLGKVFYQNVAALGDKAPDEPAVEADDYVKSQAHQSMQQSKYLWFGFMLLAVGLALGVLSLWAYHDVRVMRGETAAAPETPAAMPPDAQPQAPTAEAAPPGSAEMTATLVSADAAAPPTEAPPPGPPAEPPAQTLPDDQKTPPKP